MPAHDEDPAFFALEAEKREFSHRHMMAMITKMLGEGDVSLGNARTLGAFVHGGMLEQRAAEAIWTKAGGDPGYLRTALITRPRWVGVPIGEGEDVTVHVISESWNCGVSPGYGARAALDEWLKITRFRLHAWQGQIWRYSNGQYKPVEDGEMRRILTNDFSHAVHVSGDRMVQVGVNATLTTQLLQTLKDMRHRESARGPETALSFRNGTLDVKTGRLEPHNPNRFVIGQIAADYSPAATCPEWERFIASSMPDPEQRELLQEVCGYLLSGRQDLQKIFGFWGQPRSGKSTIMRVVGQLLGPNSIASPSLASLTGSFGLAAAKDARIIQIGEARFDRDNKSSIDLLLRISGLDAVEVNVKNKPAFMAILPGRIVMVSNEQPNVLEDSGALAKRFVHLGFKVSFFGREDTNLDAKLGAELAGIANWCLVGLKRLDQRGKFLQTAEHGRAARQQDLTSNHALVWYSDCVRVGTGTTTARQIEDSYLAWCDLNDIEETVRFTANRLGRMLTGKGHAAKRDASGNSRVRAGMVLTDLAESDAFEAAAENASDDKTAGQGRSSDVSVTSDAFSGERLLQASIQTDFENGPDASVPSDASVELAAQREPAGRELLIREFGADVLTEIEND